jgi:hypothetical protein
VQHEMKTQQSERQLRRQELQERIDRARKREESERRNKSVWIARQHVKKTVRTLVMLTTLLASSNGIPLENSSRTREPERLRRFRIFT